MAFTTFVFFQVFNVFNARDERQSVFHRDTLRNGKLWLAVAVVVVLQVLAVTSTRCRASSTPPTSPPPTGSP